MSFILDALARAEQERRLGEIAALDANVASKKRASTHVAWFAAIAFGIAAGLGAGWFVASRSGGVTSGASVDTDEPVLAATPAPVVTPTPAESPRPVAPPIIANVAPPVPAELPHAPPVAPPVQTTRITESAEATARDRGIQTADVAPPGLAPVEIQVHVWDEDASARFVLIDLRKYREGDALPNGARLAEITRSGIIAEAQGSRYRVETGGVR